MNDFTMMHIFFTVTTLAVVILTLTLAVLAWYVWRILRTVDTFTQAALDEATMLRADIGELRGTVRREGFKLRYFTRFFTKQAERFTKKKPVSK